MAKVLDPDLPFVGWQQTLAIGNAHPKGWSTQSLALALEDPCSAHVGASVEAEMFDDNTLEASVKVVEQVGVRSTSVMSTENLVDAEYAMLAETSRSGA